MQKIHHFVHLGYTPENHSEYQEKILNKLEDIREKIRAGANDIIVMVKDGENVTESLAEMNVYKLLEHIATVINFYNIQLRNPDFYIIPKLANYSIPIEIIEEILNELKKHKEILKNKLVYEKRSIEKFENIEKEIKKIINYREKKGDQEFIDNYIINLYYDIFKKMLRKYEKKNIFGARLSLDRNTEFRKRINDILKVIPGEKIATVNIRGYDLPYEVLGLNTSFKSHEIIYGEHYKKMKELIGIQIALMAQKRLKKEFRGLKSFLDKKSDKEGSEHLIYGEYIDYCVANYSGFIQYYLDIEKEKIKTQDELCLHSRVKTENKPQNNSDIFYIK